MELYMKFLCFSCFFLMQIGMIVPVIAVCTEKKPPKPLKLLFIFTVFTASMQLWFGLLANKDDVIETGEKYEVVQIMGGKVTCINENNELVTEALYDICYDKNAENLYAIKMSIQREFTFGILDKDVGKYWFRVYTNDKSYVEEQNVYYKARER